MKIFCQCVKCGKNTPQREGSLVELPPFFNLACCRTEWWCNTCQEKAAESALADGRAYAADLGYDMRREGM